MDFSRLPNTWGTTCPARQASVYLLLSIYSLSALLGIVFSKAGHFTAYGIAMGLAPLLWALFWEGFPLLGLDPSWTDSLGLAHLDPVSVIVFAVVAGIIITIVFVPLELREKYLQRKRRLTADD